MATWNVLMRGLFDGLLYPLRNLPPLLGLAIVSLPTAIFMLLVWRRASDQKAVARVKRLIHACLFEIRLFNDDLGAILRAQVEILRHNVTYLKLSLVPMLFVIPPLVVVMAQFQYHFGYSGLASGKPAVVKVVLEKGGVSDGNALSLDGHAKPGLSLTAPPAIRVDSPPVWIPSLRELDWRIVPEAPGDYELLLAGGGETYSKTVRVSDSVVRRSPVRVKQGFLGELFHPAEAPLPREGRIRSIHISYPENSISIFRWQLPWMVVYFALVMIFAFALKRPFKVDF